MAFRIAWRLKNMPDKGGAGEYVLESREKAQPAMERMMKLNPDMECWIEEEVWPEIIGADWWPEVIGV
jgi:hypothetical protein